MWCSRRTKYSRRISKKKKKKKKLKAKVEKVEEEEELAEECGRGIECKDGKGREEKGRERKGRKEGMGGVRYTSA
ncbi:hypothetical protein M0802_010285 [Mischocyttarus mexicanus]|nr:hypothetical protein M0802_010285 [Mischocyttarus mexicanus]